MLNQDAILSNIDITNSYLICGMRGSGKTTLSKEMVRLSIEKICPEYVHLYPENYPDFIYMNGGNVDAIHELISKVSLKPYYKKHFVIINNFDTVTIQGQNLLLKTLEESDVMFLLISNNDSRILPTINSRCNRISPKLLSCTNIFEILKKEYNAEFNYDDQYLNLVSKLSNGSLGKGIKYVQKQVYKEFIDDMMNISSKNFLILATKYAKDNSKDKDSVERKQERKEEKQEFFYIIESIIRDKMISASAAKKNQFYNLVLKIQEYKKELVNNANYEMILQNIFLEFSKI